MPQPVPAVPGIPAGTFPVQADFTTWVTTPFTYLAQPVVFRGHRAAAQSLTGGAYQLIDLDTVDEDPYGGWSGVATGSQPAFSWLCPAGGAGWYEATLSVFSASQGGTTDQILTTLWLNGSLWQYASDDWAPNAGDGGSNGAAQVPLLPGDYVQFWAFATVSVSTPTTAGQLPAMELAWVST